MTIGALATLIMVILKCTHNIDWAWIVVFLPMIIECAIELVVFVVVVVFMGWLATHD